MMLIIALIWLIGSWWLAKNILAKIFSFDKTVINLLAVFLPLFILGPLANIFNAWFKLTDLTIYLSFVLSWAMLFIGNRLFEKDNHVPEANPSQSDITEDQTSNLFIFYKWLYVVFGLLAALGFYIISQTVTSNYLNSPWDVLSGWQILIAMGLMAIIAYAIYCRKIPTVAILLMIMVFSLLMHSYLLVYKSGFGGDRFRHLGSEERIIQGLEYQPTLLTSNLWYKNFGPLKYPQALTDSAKLSYGTMWSLEVIAAKISGWPVFQINRFLLPILWSIFLTVIIFVLAYLLRPNNKFALLSALLANSVYLFQYYGAQGLPASYGLLWLAYYWIFLVSYLKQPTRSKLWLLIAGLILMYFNYSLAFLLAGIGLLLTIALVKKKLMIYILAPLSIVFLCGLDYLSSPSFSFAWSKVLPAWAFGNLLDFQSLNRLVPMIGEWHLVDLLLMVGLAVILIVSLFRIWRQQDPAWLLLALMAKIILASYFLSYWFLNGEHSLARRLTLFAVLFLIIILSEAAVRIIKGQKSFVAVSLTAILLTALTYYSGPALNVTVSDRELDKARAIWHDIEGKSDYCVKDDLNVILALEYVSAKGFQETINTINCGK